jgi:hypothetical protein
LRPDSFDSLLTVECAWGRTIFVCSHALKPFLNADLVNHRIIQRRRSGLVHEGEPLNQAPIVFLSLISIHTLYATAILWAWIWNSTLTQNMQNAVQVGHSKTAKSARAVVMPSSCLAGTSYVLHRNGSCTFCMCLGGICHTVER